MHKVKAAALKFPNLTVRKAITRLSSKDKLFLSDFEYIDYSMFKNVPVLS